MVKNPIDLLVWLILYLRSVKKYYYFVFLHSLTLIHSNFLPYIEAKETTHYNLKDED